MKNNRVEEVFYSVLLGCVIFIGIALLVTGAIFFINFAIGCMNESGAAMEIVEDTHKTKEKQKDSLLKILEELRAIRKLMEDEHKYYTYKIPDEYVNPKRSADCAVLE